MKVAAVYCRNPRVEMAMMKDEAILFNPTNNKFCLLNVTAAFIWESLDERMGADEIARKLQLQFQGVAFEQARSDVVTTLDEFCAIGFISVS